MLFSINLLVAIQIHPQIVSVPTAPTTLHPEPPLEQVSSMAYLSKRLDSVAARWPACLRAMVATVLLVKEADKGTLGQELSLTTPHSVEVLLRGKPER